ncbi:MAG: polysaccharide biosynthesis protein [Firmicutes bacterium]|nr:polysaccharide biosynthesis protein [Bacillota bacterium]
MVHKRKIILLGDAVLINLSFFLGLLIKFDGLPSIEWSYCAVYCLVCTFIRIISLYYFCLYNRVWEYASINELISTIKAVTVGSLINLFLAYFVFQSSLFSFSLAALIWTFNIMLLGGSRLFLRIVRSGVGNGSRGTGKRVLIIGAGDAGALVAKELVNHYQGRVNIIGFIDDDPFKQNYRLLDYKILGTRTDIPRIVSLYNIDEIIIAMPSVVGRVVSEIVDICHLTDAKVKILPGVFEIIEGNVKVSQIREVRVEDLLGREQVEIDLDSMSAYVSNRVVLVTGAGGSIGSELCRQIVKFEPKKLLLLDICENNIYDIEMDLRSITDVELVPLVKDIKDWIGINQVFRTYKPDVIYHAAAHKHVPLMERNPEEAIKNNVMGTYIVAQAANVHNADRFVLVSTDKAVNPTSVMGASKRIAEMVIQYLNTVSRTNYVGVRFGNVLGSRGSVIPLFKKQIAKGGPVTVTHKDIIRYFMTIPEAVQLIIQAGAFAKGGEIFVLDMGEPVRIMDLANTLIKLSGFEPGEDIEIKVIGMRPGEKLYEELLTTEEVRGNKTSHERIFIAPPCDVDNDTLSQMFKEFLAGNLPYGYKETEKWLQRLLPDFKIVRHEHPQEVIATAKSEIASTQEFNHRNLN